jgi:predicted Zn-dependent protease
MAPHAGSSPGDVMVDAARELRAHGHRPSSIEMAGRAAEWYRSRPAEVVQAIEYRLGLARALYLAERWDEARATFAVLARDVPDTIEFAGRLGVIAARQGDEVTARAMLADLRQRRSEGDSGEPSYAAAGIAALLDERNEAVALLREAFARGLAHGFRVHTETALEPLLDYPPFVELVRPKG